MVDVITASCGSVDCPRAFECARSIVNGEPCVSYCTTDYYHTGWAMANSNGETSEGWDCGERGNWALFFKLPDPTEPICCPFCKNTDIRYSIKTSGSDYRFHAAYYCNKCHCYGPRILSDPYDKHTSRHEVKKDETLKKKAFDAWNKRR